MDGAERSRGLKRHAEDYTSDTRGRNRKNGQNNNYITILKYWLQYLNITIYETILHYFIDASWLMHFIGIS